MSKPEIKNGLMYVFVEPDTWCNPMHAVGILVDLAEMAWDQRAKSHDPARRFTARQAEALLALMRRAADARLQDVKGIARMRTALKDTTIEGDGYSNGFKTLTHFTMARRVDAALELHEIRSAVLTVLEQVLPAPNRYHHVTGKRLRNRVRCPLGYFDMWTWNELELRWRLRDARWKAGTVRGQRADAFEAMWMGGEHEKAYEFVGAKLPPEWEDE